MVDILLHADDYHDSKFIEQYSFLGLHLTKLNSFIIHLLTGD